MPLYSLDDVIITDDLARRAPRAPDYRVEADIFAILTEELADRPDDLLQTLCDTLVTFGIAHSAGISLLDRGDADADRGADTDGDPRFHWVALSGHWAPFRGGTMPLDASPCGVVIRRDAMLLFEHPERVFPAAHVEPLIHEILLVPFHADARPIGTLWINAHDATRKFDATDVRLLRRLSRFASAAHRMTSALAAARSGRADLERQVEAHARALRESEARLSAAFEGVPVGIAVIDTTGRAMVSNPEYRRFLPSGYIPSRDPDRVARWRAWDDAGRPIDPQSFPGARALRGEWIVPGQEMLYTDDDGREIWTRVATVPVLDDAGRVTALTSVISDIDTLKRSTDALRESEERLRQFGEASQDILWIRDAATLQWTYLTPAFETIYGVGRDEALSGDNYRSWLDMIVPEDRAHAADAIARVRAGEHVTFDYRVRRPSDGAIRWLRNTDFPINNEAGELTLIGGIGHDTTELREIDLRLRTLVEGMPQLVWRAVDGGGWTWASPQWMRYTGLEQADSTGQGWLVPLHPDDRELVRAAWDRAADSGGFSVEHRIRRAEDGAYRWFHTRATPVRDAAGQIVEWLGTSTDVHDLRDLQEHQTVLVAELQHRTRNLMGVVRSMADKTARASDDLPDFRLRFRDRLEALARVQGLLSRLNDVDRVTFDALIHAELAAMDADPERITLQGPKAVRLRSSTVQTLAMALHELATNAVKYGALGQATGHLTIGWALDEPDPAGRPWLHIDWRETGVAMAPAGSKARGSGQGRELIERALPYQLKARTTYTLEADGVHCTISIPVSARRGEGAEQG